MIVENGKNKFMEFKLFLLCKKQEQPERWCKFYNSNGSSAFLYELEERTSYPYWCHLHIFKNRQHKDSVYSWCVLRSEYNFDGLCHVQNKESSRTFCSNKRFCPNWVYLKRRGAKAQLKLSHIVPPTLIQLKEYQFLAEILRQSKRDPSVRLDFL